jgi:tetratricopeptide (TPR) repeat protein
MSARFLRSVLAVIFVLTLAGLFLPPAASGFYLNLANAAIARAEALPPDAPERSTTLTEADAHLNRAQVFFNLDRLALAQARIALARGDVARAADTFDGSRLQNSDPVTEYLWANAEWQANRQAVALEHWRQAGAITFFMQEAHRALDAHNWKKAADLASLATSVDPNLADAHYVLAEGLSRDVPITPRVFDELERARSLTRDPELLAAILSRKAEVLAGEGKLDQALQVFSEARQIAPVDARPRTGYALTLLALQPLEREQANALLEQVIDDSPWYTAAYIALAGMAESRGDLKGAEAWLEKGLARNPNDARLLLPLGRLFSRHGRAEEAKATLVRALQLETHADDLKEIDLELSRLRAP